MNLKYFLNFLSLFWIASSGVISAQNSDTPKDISSSYVIKEVHIIASPVAQPIFGNIVIEDGLITGIGRGLIGPYDAIHIEGDSMYAYAALIDAMSHSGIPKKEKEERPDVKDPGNPSDDVAGILPGRSVTDLMDVNKKTMSDLRKSGFGICHVVPQGNMLPGQGAIMLTHGDDISGRLLMENASLYAQFSSSRGVFPATIIGIMAKWRELYHQAESAKKHEGKYSINKSGMVRPTYSKTIEAMYPVIEKRLPVFFRTSKSLDVHRAMTLYDELGFDIVLAELKQGWRNLDEIKSKNIPVLLSTDLPKEEKKKKDEKEKKDKEKDKKIDKDKKDEKKDKEEDSEEIKLFKERKSKSVDEYVSQAAAFEKAGIPFGFSFIKGKHKDVHASIRRMIEKGLSEKAALSALTTYPAKLLSISSVVGTLEIGKIANVIITTKPYFDEKSKIKYVFVDGAKEEYEVKEKKKKSDGDSSGIDGEWEFTVEGPTGSETQTMTIEKTGDTYKVSMAGSENMPPTVIEDVELDGNVMNYKFDIEDGGFSFTVEIALEFDGDEMEGSATAGDFGSFPIEGSKVNPEY